MSDRLLDKIAALLTQAERTDNPAEAEAFFAKAQSLATTNSIDLAVARAKTAKKEQREVPIQRRIKLATRADYSRKYYVGLFGAVASPNGVQYNIAHDSTYVNAFGMPSDIDVVEAIFASVLITMVTTGDAYIKSGAYKSEFVNRPVYVTEEDWYGRKTRYVSHYAPQPVHGKVARGSFYRGFSQRIQTRLQDARREQEALVKDQVVEFVNEAGLIETVGTEVVLRNKEVEVRDYYKATSTARGSWKGVASSGSSSQARRAGDSAGRSARLGGSQGAISGGGRALTG